MNTTVYSLVVIYGTLLFSIALLQAPFFQTFLAKKTTSYLNSKTDYHFNINRVEITWYDEIQLHEVHIYDSQERLMISSRSATLDFFLDWPWEGELFNYESIILIDPHTQIVKDKDAEVFEIQKFATQLQSLFDISSTPDTSAFNLINVSIINGHFHFLDLNKDTTCLPSSINYANFELDSISLDLKHLHQHLDSVSIEVDHLSLKNLYHGISINAFQGKGSFCPRSIQLSDYNLRTSESNLNGYIQIVLDSNMNIKPGFDAFSFDLKTDNASISTNELGVFFSETSSFEDTWRVSGHYQGRIPDFKSYDADISFGKSSRLKGHIALEGLPKIRETFLDLDFKQSNVSIRDLYPYIGSSPRYKDLLKLGHIDFTSDFYGYPESFVAHGAFTTDLGFIKSDLQFRSKDEKEPTYEGVIVLRDFDIGRYSNIKRLGKTSLVGEIDGKGFTKQKAKITVESHISELEYNDYIYSEITSDATLQLGFFEGAVSIEDPNLKAELNGTLDFREQRDSINVAGEIFNSDFKKLNFSEDSLNIKTKLELNFVGLDIDSIQGTGTLSDNKVNFKGQPLALNDFHFLSKFDSSRYLKIESQVADIELEGDYTIRKLIKSSTTVLDEIKLILRNDSSETHHYFSNRIIPTDSISLDYDVLIKDISPITSTVFEDFSISNHSSFNGHYQQGKKYVLDFHSEFDTLEYKNLRFIENSVSTSFEKELNDTRINAFSYVYSAQQEYNNKSLSQELFVQSLWDNKKIVYKTYIERDKQNNIDLAGEIEFGNNQTNILLNNSFVTLDSKQWDLSEGNNVSITRDEVTFNQFQLKSNNQKIGLKGTYSFQDQDSLEIYVSKFRLNNLSELLGFPLKGRISGDVSMISNHDNLRLKGITSISQLNAKNFAIGDISGQWTWDKLSNQFLIESNLQRNNDTLCRVDGSILTNESQKLDLIASFDDTDINILHPFIEDDVSDLKGTLKGEIVIGGTIPKPTFNGIVDVKNTEFKINYLNTSYQINDKITFKNDSIIAKNILLKDKLWKTTARMSGGLKHQLFNHFETFVRIDLNKTFIFNNSKKDNDLFYGPAFASGQLFIEGPFDNIKIRSPRLQTDRIENAFTYLNIPLESTGTNTNVSYIKFVNPYKTETTKTKTENKQKDSRLSLDLNLIITPEATIDIILNEKAGDVIHSSGEGKIHMVVDDNGEFTMYGDYNIINGGYNFTLAKLPVKKFALDEGSKISWKGDPYAGQMNILAKYTQNASIRPLFTTEINAASQDSLSDQDYTSQHPEILQTAKTDVILRLNGDLLAPEFGFDIEVIEYPNTTLVQNKIQELKSNIRFNEQELNRQVFGLMLLRQFLPLQDNSLGADAVAGSANNVSEIFTSQFSNMLSQFDENLQVDIDLNAFDENFDNNSLRLKLSYSVLDGRIRISRDGSFNNSNTADDQELANLVGDWTVEYLLSDDGKIRIKAYNKNNQNVLYTGGSNDGSSASNSTVYGVSLSYTAEFDNLKELIENRKTKKEKEREQLLKQKEAVNRKEDDD